MDNFSKFALKYMFVPILFYSIQFRLFFLIFSIVWQGFFLIRIPKLQTELQIKLNLEDCTVPLLSCVVEEVKKITYNHKPKYIGNVEKILPNLSENVSCYIIFIYNFILTSIDI